MLSLVSLALTTAYIAILFAIAWWYERPAAKTKGNGLLGPSLYALSLAVYCSSWTYYGAVGTASRNGWEYLALYIGPIVGITLLFPLWRRIASTARRESVGSIAEFISTRYGKSPALGALVTVVAIVGSLPYVALQLRSLALASQTVETRTPLAISEPLIVLLLAGLLAGFAILFGARRTDLTEHNRGLIQAIGVESIIKLAGLLAIAVFAIIVLIDSPQMPQSAIPALGKLAELPQFDTRFWAIIIVSALAIFCLPRQFHVGFVEGGAPEEARRAQWLFPLYLCLTSLAVIPLVMAGQLTLPGVDPDAVVLALPFETDKTLLTSLVLVGGFSAATAMVIIETLALSAMVSNNLVLPLYAHLRRQSPQADSSISFKILTIRRIAIVTIVLMAWIYYLVMDQSQGLAAIGLVSFAALAQLAPSLIGAVTWRTGHAKGAISGICAGMTVWLFMLALPQLVPSLSLHLPAIIGMEDAFPTGVFLSLTINIALYVIVSRQCSHRLIDRVQARAFVDHLGPEWLDHRPNPAGASVHDLRMLVGRFIGEDRARNAFNAWAREANTALRDSDPANAGLARASERMLAGAVGGVAARRVISAALAGGGRAPEDVVRMLDEASLAVQFNRDLLLTTLDNIDQAVSVVDEDLRLVAWNLPYEHIFATPSGFLHVGMPIKEVYLFNASKPVETLGNKTIEEWTERRLSALRRRRSHELISTLPDGRILRAVGEPIKGGAYVTSYTDITDLSRAAEQLEEANERLEARVIERTEQLEAARDLAENATASKTRFLAAASHDLLQPLHAARLFIAALREDPVVGQSQAHSLANNADRSIESAHRLLTALLNLSKLEAGGVQPAVTAMSLGQLFDDIAREFTPMAKAKGLELVVKPTGLWISSDRDLLRSMLQNLIANAIRYTDQGRVLLGARRIDGRIGIVVCDTGRGISEDDQATIFGEFVRLPGAPVDEPAAGLGLAIVSKLSDLLDHPIQLRSNVGHGTGFTITVPRAAPVQRPVQKVGAETRSRLNGMRILCVDNEPVIREALQLLLQRWGAEPVIAASLQDVQALDEIPDAALVDLHLGDHAPDGFAVIAHLQGQGVERIALVTADTRDSLGEQARAACVTLLRKPVKPATLKAFLSS